MTETDLSHPRHASHQFLICGFGSLGQYCVEGLRQFSSEDSQIAIEIINLESPTEWVIDAREQITPLLKLGDCRDPETLKQAGIETAQAALFVTSDERVNIQGALAARSINPDIRLVVRSSKENLNDLLESELGNFTALNPAELPASAFVNAVVTSEQLASFDLEDREFLITQHHVGENSPFTAGHKLSEYESSSTRIVSWTPQDGTAEAPDDLPTNAFYQWTEETVLHIVRALEAQSPSRNLVITGGVALNCVSNARILRDTAFERVWVPPCASDTGAPLGAALYHTHQTLGLPRVMEMTHPFYGQSYGDEAIEAALAEEGLAYERIEDDQALFDRVARDLANEKIVGWFQGRYEIGPRALGNRSILADPRSLKTKDLINARIKVREAFRPFAPAVLLERAQEFFEIDQPDPFMTMAPRVRRDKLDVIPAAVHVDGTGRIQTVRREDNPRYHAVIKAFGDLTGVPVLINTSFNCHEPIVTTPKEAVSCYLRTAMDRLVIGNYYVADRNEVAEKQAVKRFKELSLVS